MGSAAPSLEENSYLDRLDAFVGALPSVSSRLQDVRSALYQAARSLNITDSAGHIIYCDAPTGSGKTIALAALALRLARHFDLERIVIVLPFLTLTRQTTGVLQAALEAATGDRCVIESSSAAVYETKTLKKSAREWKLPVIVTTSASFMEALTSPNGRRRTSRIDQLSRSVVICDDVDQWLRPELAPMLNRCFGILDSHGARVVLSSATLPHFWELPTLVTDPLPVKNFAADTELVRALGSRAKVERVPKALSFESLAGRIGNMKGSGLVVCNTIATAGRLAAFLRDAQSERHVYYISSSVAKSKKRANEDSIRKILAEKTSSIILIATSAVEAGWDVSFEWGFREESSLASLLQTAGRVNRGLEFDNDRPVYSFTLTDLAATSNPALELSRVVLGEVFRKSMVTAAGCTESVRLLMELDPKISRMGHSLLHALDIGDWDFLSRKSKPLYFAKSSMFLPPCEYLSTTLQVALNDAKRKALSDSVTGAAFYEVALTLSPSMPEKHPDHFERVLINGAEWFEIQKPHFDPELGYIGDNEPVL